VRLLADTNIAASIVAALRARGHDVVYSAEREQDPGDLALLAEAHAERRILISKDHDMGALVHRDLVRHSGVILLDDPGDPLREEDLLLRALAERSDALSDGAFVRATEAGFR